MFACPECDFCCRNKKSLRIHTCRGNLLPDLICEFCSYVSKNRIFWLIHNSSCASRPNVTDDQSSDLEDEIIKATTSVENSKLMQNASISDLLSEHSQGNYSSDIGKLGNLPRKVLDNVISHKCSSNYTVAAKNTHTLPGDAPVAMENISIQIPKCKKVEILASNSVKIEKVDINLKLQTKTKIFNDLQATNIFYDGHQTILSSAPLKECHGVLINQRNDDLKTDQHTMQIKDNGELTYKKGGITKLFADLCAGVTENLLQDSVVKTDKCLNDLLVVGEAHMEHLASEMCENGIELERVVDKYRGDCLAGNGSMEDSQAVHDTFCVDEACIEQIAKTNLSVPNCIELSVTDRLIHHRNEFECTICCKSYSRRDTLSLHIRSRHPLCGSLYNCTECTATFQRKYNLQQHKRKVHAKFHNCFNVPREKNSTSSPARTRTFPCLKCDKCYNYQHSLRRHMCMVHSETTDSAQNLSDKTYSSLNHPKIFKWKCNVQKHQQLRHHTRKKRNGSVNIGRKKENEHKKVNCKLCSFTSTSLQVLRSHLLRHHKKPLLNCEFCKYTTVDSSYLELHYLDHKEQKKESVISETLTNKSAKSAPENSPFLCHECSLVCSSNSNFKKSRLKLAEIEKHKCSSCTYSSNSQSHSRNNSSANSKGGGMINYSDDDTLQYQFGTRSWLKKHKMHDSHDSSGSHDFLHLSSRSNVQLKKCQIILERCDDVNFIPGKFLVGKSQLKKLSRTVKHANSEMVQINNFHKIQIGSQGKEKKNLLTTSGKNNCYVNVNRNSLNFFHETVSNKFSQNADATATNESKLTALPHQHCSSSRPLTKYNVKLKAKRKSELENLITGTALTKHKINWKTKRRSELDNLLLGSTQTVVAQKRHSEFQLNPTRSPSKEKQRFECDICYERFDCFYDLRNHRKHYCPYCSARIMYAKVYKEHVEYHERLLQNASEDGMANSSVSHNADSCSSSKDDTKRMFRPRRSGSKEDDNNPVVDGNSQLKDNSKKPNVLELPSGRSKKRSQSSNNAKKCYKSVTGNSKKRASQQVFESAVNQVRNTESTHTNFECTICYESCSANFQFSRHKHRCPYCMNRIRSTEAYRQHVHNHELCIEGHTEEKEEHPTTVSDQKQIQTCFVAESCSICKLDFCHSRMKMEGHVDFCAGVDKKGFTCDLCPGKIFPRSGLYQYHLLSDHPAPRSINADNCKNKICKKCGRSYLCQQQLKLHEMNHTETKMRKYRCKVCDLYFWKKSILSSHIYTHHDLESYFYTSCPTEKSASICIPEPVTDQPISRLEISQVPQAQYSKVEKSSLPAEEPLKLGKEIFRCKSFELATENRSIMQDTAVEDINLKLYSCPMCAEQFQTKLDHANHLMVHKKDCSAACHLCDASYLHNSNLRHHLRIVHQLTSKTPQQEHVNTHGNSKICTLEQHEVQNDISNQNSNSGEGEYFSLGGCQSQQITNPIYKKFASNNVDVEVTEDLNRKESYGKRKSKSRWITHPVYEIPKVKKINVIAEQHQQNNLQKHEPFICPICNMEYMEMISLQYHIAKHTKLHTLHCYICRYDFSYIEHLQKHMQFAHGIIDHTFEEPTIKLETVPHKQPGLTKETSENMKESDDEFQIFTIKEENVDEVICDSD